jgi:murein L,D-transpeptidase YafK
MAEARSIDDVVKHHGPDARARLRPHFERSGVTYPPSKVWLVALKEEKQLELWAGGKERRHIRDYEIQAASGEAGPKRRQGDLQVPEGVYRILWLNPESSYHLSMKVDYPNDFDRARARLDGRTNLGGDIFIHGRAVSIGCLAMGDPAIEELFVLAADVGVKNLQVVIAPHDMRRRPASLGPKPDPSWLPELYAILQEKLRAFSR